MSNPGLVVLAKARGGTKNLRNFVIEDNIGEAVHIHWNNLRIDFSIDEFLIFSEQVEDIFRNLSSHGYPDFLKLDTVLLGLIGAQVGAIVRIEQERRPIRSLQLVDDTHPASKIGQQVILFGDEPYIRFGADFVRDLKSKDNSAELSVTVVHFSGNQWRLEDLQPPTQRVQHNEPGSSHHTVMIIAGMSGSGKTTILRDSLVNKRPLFGLANDDVFQATKLPSIFPENGLPLDERLSLNTWVHEIDLVSLHRRGVNSRNLVVHFDIYWFLATAHEWNKSIPSTLDTALFRDFLLDSKRIAELFRLVFKLLPVQRANCLIRTLKPDFPELCTRWVNREEKTDQNLQGVRKGFLSKNIYYDSEEGKMIYENIYTGWKLATETISTGK